MAIEKVRTVTVAATSVTDDYGVQLVQRRKRVSYSWEEAIQLANELVDAAERAKAMWRDDQIVSVNAGVFEHGFDIDLHYEADAQAAAAKRTEAGS